MLYMEMALGQYHKTGTISLWKICPLFKGKTREGISDNCMSLGEAL